MNRKLLLIIGLILGLIASNLIGQTRDSDTEFILNLDYARFLYNTQTGYVEVYYGFHPKHLTYNFEGGKYNGGVKITTKIKNKDTNEIVVNKQSCLQLSEADTSAVWFRYPFISQAGYTIPNGSYSLEVMVEDSLAPSKCDSLALNLNIMPEGTGATASDM